MAIRRTRDGERITALTEEVPVGAVIEEPPPPPAVSAVLVSYNNAPALRQAVAALEASEERHRMEIVVVDNGSRDGCAQIDQEFPEVNVLRLPKNFGLVKAMNIGARTATGDNVFYVRPEVEVRPDTVRRLRETLSGTPAALAAVPLLVSPSGDPVPELSPLPSRSWIEQAALRGIHWENRLAGDEPSPVEVEGSSTTALMIRRPFLKGMRYLDERLGHYWADVELAIQIWRAAKKILLVTDAPVARHPAPQWDGFRGEARTELAGDRLTGAGILIDKHFGGIAGLQYRMGASARLLAKAATFQEPGHNLGRWIMMVTGGKIDGSQRYV